MGKSLFIYGVFFAGLLAACTLTPRDTGAAFMFALNPVKISQPGPQKEVLLVSLPTTAPELDTYRIALKRDDRRWDYYEGARWPDFLPVVVQNDMTRTLVHAGLFKNVATDEAGLIGDMILKTEIIAFQAEYTAGSAAPVIKIRITASLVGRLEMKPLSSFTIDAEKKAAGNNLSAIQAAFAAAFNDVQRQLAGKLVTGY